MSNSSHAAKLPTDFPDSDSSGTVSTFHVDADLVTKAAMSHNHLLLSQQLAKKKEKQALFTISEVGDNTG